MAQLSDYLAAERTFLAWLRTGLALMGFGFVVARFGLFLQQIQLAENTAMPRNPGLSLWFGTSLILAGIVVSVLSAWRHIRIVQELNRGGTGFVSALSLVISVAAFLSLIGIAMAIYLFVYSFGK